MDTTGPSAPRASGCAPVDVDDEAEVSGLLDALCPGIGAEQPANTSAATAATAT
jgi:hypothetical protein